MQLSFSSLTKSPRKITKLVALASSLVLSACGYSFTNIPTLTPNLAYITIQSSDLQFFRAMQRSLTQASLTVISPDATKEQLSQVVTQISKLEVRSQAPALTALTKAQQERALANATPPQTKQSSAQNRNNKAPTAVLGGYAHDNNISECVGENLTFACVAKYIPHLAITNISRQNKSLSLFTDGTTAQQLVVTDVQSDLYIPYLGKIEINEILTDSQLYNAQDPLTNLRAKETLEQVYNGLITDALAAKVIYVLQAQTNAQLYQLGQALSEREYKIQQTSDRLVRQAQQEQKALQSRLDAQKN